APPERRLQALPPPAERAVGLPEAACGPHGAWCRGGVARLQGVREGGPEVVVLAVPARQPNSLIAACQAELRLVGERHKVLEVPAASLVVLAGCAQSLEGVVAYDLKQGEARLLGLALAHEALVYQGREPFQ